MPSLIPLRKRIPVPTTGANVRIAHGLFGVGNPAYAIAEIQGLPGSKGIYHYHLGDLFTPGAQALVLESPFELPLQTLWGFATLRRPNTFNPLHPNPYVAMGAVVTNGLGGLQTGQLMQQPLLEQG